MHAKLVSFGQLVPYGINIPMQQSDFQDNGGSFVGGASVIGNALTICGGGLFIELIFMM